MSGNPSTLRLRESDRASLLAHFLALDAEDRRLRFGSAISDAGIAAYVQRIDFEHDGLFTVHDDNLAMLAVVHVAVDGNAAEMGLSVLHGWRGQGLGDALFQRAVTFLRNRSVGEASVHCLAENGAMMHLARKNGMRVVLTGTEGAARLALDPPTAQSFIGEWLSDQQGLAIRTLRENARTTQRLMGLARG